MEWNNTVQEHFLESGPQLILIDTGATTNLINYNIAKEYTKFFENNYIKSLNQELLIEQYTYVILFDKIIKTLITNFHDNFDMLIG